MLPAVMRVASRIMAVISIVDSTALRKSRPETRVSPEVMLVWLAVASFTKRIASEAPQGV